MARPRSVSVYFNDKRSYLCPKCKTEMERAHVHGWFWFCEACKTSYPLRDLEHFEVKPIPKEDGILTKFKRAFLGREDSSGETK